MTLCVSAEEANDDFGGRILKIQSLTKVGDQGRLDTVGTGACIRKDLLVTTYPSLISEASIPSDWYANGLPLTVVARHEGLPIVLAKSEGKSLLTLHKNAQ